MKTKQIILPAVLAAFTAGGITAYHFSTFASDEGTSTSTDATSKCGPEGMSGHRGGMRGMKGGMFGVQQYIDVENLSGDAKTTYDNALNAFHETMKANMEANKDSTGDNTAMQESMKTAWTTFMQSVRSLVSSDKLTEFDAFVAKGPQAPAMGEGKGMGGEGRGERMGSGMFGLKEYIDFDSLTGDTKTAFDAIVKDHKEKVKTALDSAKDSSGDNTAAQETMKTLWTEFMTSIRPYVSSDKLTEFDAFVAKGPQTPAMGEGMGRGGEGRGERMGGGMFGVQQYIDVENLSGDAKTTYDNALNAFHETMKANMEANKDSTGDNTAMQESMKTSWTTFMQSVRSLVSSDKLTEFDAFVAKGPQTPAMGEGKGMRGMGKHNKQSTSSTTDLDN